MIKIKQIVNGLLKVIASILITITVLGIICFIDDILITLGY